MRRWLLACVCVCMCVSKNSVIGESVICVEKTHLLIVYLLSCTLFVGSDFQIKSKSYLNLFDLFAETSLVSLIPLDLIVLIAEKHEIFNERNPLCSLLHESIVFRFYEIFVCKNLSHYYRFP